MSEESMMRLIGIIEKLVEENERLHKENERLSAYRTTVVPSMTYTKVSNPLEPPYKITCNGGGVE